MFTELTESQSLPSQGDFVRASLAKGSGEPVQEPVSWRQAIKLAVREPVELGRILNLSKEFELASGRFSRDFPLFAPREFVARMAPGNPADPLLRQVLPVSEELVEAVGFRDDPVGDQAATLTPGLVRKYSSRALLITTGACAVHCRYCFRRHFPYESAPKAVEAWQPALAAIAADPQIDEVILSGGDPLTLVDEMLGELAERIAGIAQVKRLRIHTRLPIVIPQRVTSDLLAWLRGTRLTTIMVVHANHPNEIDEATSQALTRLVDAGVPTLNQSVLLRGVNDDAESLIELNRKLVDLRVMPYYLHQLDRVRGAGHFEVPQSRGECLIEEMRKTLPGYAVPRYVREVEGDTSKRVIA